MKKHVILILASVLALCWLASCMQEGPSETTFKQGETAFKPDVPEGGRLVSANGWHLVIEYRLKGTRSEGQHGRLYHGRDEIIGGEGDDIDTPLGKMKHYGKDFEQPWETTGWNYADTSMIKNSLELEPAELLPEE